jgi:hypothetical protein
MNIETCFIIINTIKDQTCSHFVHQLWKSLFLLTWCKRIKDFIRKNFYLEFLNPYKLLLVITCSYDSGDSCSGKEGIVEFVVAIDW